MRHGQVPDMDVITDACAVPRRPIRARDMKHGRIPKSDLNQLTKDMGRLFNMHPRTHFGVCADGVEISQGNALQVIGMGKILQDHLHHILRPGIWAVGF